MDTMIRRHQKEHNRLNVKNTFNTLTTGKLSGKAREMITITKKLDTIQKKLENIFSKV